MPHESSEKLHFGWRASTPDRDRTRRTVLRVALAAVLLSLAALGPALGVRIPVPTALRSMRAKM
jgi:hypothetical protein